ncbi:MAG TPA: hypothetical protein VFO07_01285 [Roseiflexaceae bacterium]|nr:hypothetical protein [Roseiflexaceae bacterium]
MASQPIPHREGKRRHYLFAAALGLLCLCCIGPFALFIVAELISPSLTAAVMPPLYPGSRLVGTDEWGSSGGTRQTTFYQTSDTIERVRTFMERHMPAFRHTEVYPLWKKQRHIEGYISEVCNQSPLSRVVGKIITTSPFGHCATVVIYPDTLQPGATVIEIAAWWPTG